MKVVACQCSVCLFSSLPDPGLVSNGPQCTGAGEPETAFQNSPLRGNVLDSPKNIIMNSGGSSDL